MKQKNRLGHDTLPEVGKLRNTLADLFAVGHGVFMHRNRRSYRTNPGEQAEHATITRLCGVTAH